MFCQTGIIIDPKCLYLIGDPQCPIAVWKKVQSVFQKETWANKLRLRKRLYNLKLADSGDMKSHLKEFIEIFDELAVINDAVEAEHKVISLLATLPDSYSTLVTALEASQTVPTWDIVAEKLLHEEHKLKANLSNEDKCMFSKSSNISWIQGFLPICNA